MIYKYNSKLVPDAQNLRKNMTPEEKHLWYDFLKRLPMTVNRQKNIGDYIVDFYIANNRVVIELDGIQHQKEDNRKADAKRDADLQKLGITVLRFANADVNKRFNWVCDNILRCLGLTIADLKKQR